MPITPAHRGAVRRLIEGILDARSALQDGDGEALDSLQRLGRHAEWFAEHHRLDDVARAAPRLVAAGSTQAVMQADHVLAELRRALLGTSTDDIPAALIVDDDRTSRSVIRMILGAYVRTVHEAETIEQARELVRQEPIGLIILDIALEDLDGRDLLAELRRDRSLDHVPIVMFTGSQSARVRTECLALGATEVHVKPPDALVLDGAFAALTGHEDRTTLALMGDPATGFMARRMFLTAVESAAVQFVTGQRVWTVVAFGSCSPGGEWANTDRAAVVEAMKEEFKGMAEVLGRISSRLVVLLPDTNAAQATERAKRVRENCAVSVAVGGTESGTATFEEIWPVVRRMMALSQGSGEVVIVEASESARTPPNVLLVDDDVVTAELVRGVLRSDGLSVVHIREASGMMDVLSVVRPRLILLDVNLPGANGYDLLRAIRSHPRHKRIPVAILSGDALPRQVAMGLDLGAIDYIIKPFDPVVLRARVRRALETKP